MNFKWPALLSSFACVACDVTDSELTAAYRVGLQSPAQGAVEVRLELDHVDSYELLLGSLVSDQLLNIANVRATDSTGRELALRRVRVLDGSGGREREVLRLDSPPPSLRIEYEVVIPESFPLGGGGESRRSGMLDEGGCALSLPTLILEPVAPLRRVELHVDHPKGWTVLRDLPGSLALFTDESWLTQWIVSSPVPFEERDVARGGMLFCHPDTPHEVSDAIDEVVHGLGNCLGEPVLPPRIVLLPTGGNANPIELGALTTDALVDLRAIDVGGIRRLVRQLVPTWYGDSWLASNFGQEPARWFSLGLTEWLAWRIPIEIGFTERDWEASLESTWMSSPPIRGNDLLPLASRGTAGRLERRLASAVLVHELDLRLRDLGGVLGLVAGYTGTGFPLLESDDPRHPVFSSFLREARLVEPRALSFEEDWRIELSARPPRSQAAPTPRTLHLVFDHGSRGLLQDCACKVSPAGSVTRRIQAVRTLRLQHPRLVHISIGGFAPMERSAPSGLTAGEVLDHYGILMAEPHGLGFDAVTIGPEDVYSVGAHGLRVPAGLPLVACGLRGLSGLPFEIIDRDGFSIGYVGYSEHLEAGTRDEAREANMNGVTFPTDRAELERTLVELGPVVDLLVVGGTFGPRTIRRLCNPELGVDLVLVDQSALNWLDRPLGWLNDTAVAIETLGERGFTELTLFLSSEHAIVDADPRAWPLDASAPEAQDIVERVIGWTRADPEASTLSRLLRQPATPR